MVMILRESTQNIIDKSTWFILSNCYVWCGTAKSDTDQMWLVSFSHKWLTYIFAEIFCFLAFSKFWDNIITLTENKWITG